jgi:septal ring factor EnvC (AmiA/AmiB activator)
MSTVRNVSPRSTAGRRFALGAIVLALGAAFSGCVSGDELEASQRQTKLLQLEVDNAKHEREVVAAERDQSKAQIQALEHQVGELKRELDEKTRTVADMQALEERLAAARAKLGALEAQLADIRDALAAGRLDDRKSRKALLERLAQPAPAATTPAGAPAAPTSPTH